MTGRFAPRPTRPAGISIVNGWQLKRYEITLDGAPINAEIITAVDATLAAELPTASGDVEVGFVIVHHGAERVWILADLWDGDIISQHTFFAELDEPSSFCRVAPGGPTACVWELAVHSHERDAFVRHVLSPLNGPDIDAYLDDTLNTGARSNRELIDAFIQAWHDVDIDALMNLMADEPSYRASTGDGPGVDYHGRDAVRRGFAAVIDAEAASNESVPPPGEVTVFGDRIMSMWSYPTTSPSGGAVIVEGVDLWTFADGRIAVKDAYRKSFPERLSG